MGLFDNNIKCPNCGKDIAKTAQFCPYCGTKIEAADTAVVLPVEKVFDKSFMHESDMAALKSLKAIPMFTPFLKGFMNIWNERQFRIINMSSKIKLGPDQMEKYYNMLPPICEKLEINVPDLYIELNVVPNAYTSGDNNPFITLTSGLLQILPDELIPTILAHECGHIACHHVLYHTMGNMIINGTIAASGLGNLVSLPLQVAFYYWMRCSELSADRAAALCDGDAEKMTEVCMYFAGYDKHMMEGANKTLFMEQALEYKRIVDSSKWDKTLEFLMMAGNSHPYTAVRAYEIDQWTKTDKFSELLKYYQ